MNKDNIINILTNVAEEFDDNEGILEEIEKAKLEMEAARSFFENVSEPKLIDVAIYTEEVAKRRYDYLISIARKNNIRVTKQYILDKCTRIAE
ncbi:MAG: YaaL family protein [Clostridium sp.]